MKKVEAIFRLCKLNSKVLLTVAMLLVSAVAWAGDDAVPSVAANAKAIQGVQTNLNYVWTLVTAALVFFMQAGFAMVEAGFTRAKNAINIMMKNLMDFAVGSLAFWLTGFGLMFGANATGWFGTNGFMLSDFSVGGDQWVLAFWMFQCVFAATSATIVSGAMAERTRFHSYLVYSAVISAFIYPVFGSWAWGGLFHGGGWLEKMGFIDFAGSTVVHSIGGWAALAGAISLGPRLGKYGKDGRPRAIPGHNIPMTAVGVFVLWLGWFGFNPGSTNAGTPQIAMILVNTNLSGAAGCTMAMFCSWLIFKKPEIGMSLNGALAGLVGITAGCASVTPGSAIIIGAVAGGLVVFSVLFFDRIKVDDPVGAVSVHGVCGSWGTLAAGLFSLKGLSVSVVAVQLLGIGAAFVWSFGTCFILFQILKATVGLRVSEEDEREGLDVTEHGGHSYYDFQMGSKQP